MGEGKSVEWTQTAYGNGDTAKAGPDGEPVGMVKTRLQQLRSYADAGKQPPVWLAQWAVGEIEHVREWYGRRWDQLRSVLRDTDQWGRIHDIMANGMISTEHRSQLGIAEQRAERAEAGLSAAMNRHESAMRRADKAEAERDEAREKLDCEHVLHMGAVERSKLVLRYKDRYREQRDALQAEIERLREWMHRHEEEEALVCPEDVGFAEYIRALTAARDRAVAEAAAMWMAMTADPMCKAPCEVPDPSPAVAELLRAKEQVRNCAENHGCVSCATSGAADEE